MVKVIDATVFGADTDCIVNTINCVGVMGRGLALEFALRYPKLEKIYFEECKKHKIHTGTLYLYKDIAKVKIINFPTKFHFKNPSQIEWIEQGLDYFVRNYKSWDIKSIAFPLLGANNGGLDKNQVISLMKLKLKNCDIPIYICKSIVPDSVEKNMVDTFNKLIDKKVNILMALKIKNASKIKLPKISRFYELQNIEGIGKESYERIHHFFFNEEYKNIQPLYSLLK